MEKVLEITNTPNAPWTIVEANDRHFATLKIMTVAAQAIATFIEQVTYTPKPQEARSPETEVPELSELYGSVLDKVDSSKTISSKDYDNSKKFYQQKLETLQYEFIRNKRSMVIVFQGWDAAGKGGDIHRLVQELNPRLYKVIPTGPPTEIEKAHQYLWRFCKRMPNSGQITIFDRSWYGRVLVERVERLCSKEEWKRAYREINEFEKIIIGTGAIILKFWLQIDRDTQLKRFEARENDPHKRWKLTEDDWRNRSKWNEYKVAIDEMLLKTSTTNVPWTIVESNDKYYSRIKILKTVTEAIEKELKT